MVSQDPFDLTGAGDQGMMIGYACNETPELMPMPIALAHRLTRRLTEARKSGEVPWLLPDGKSQVSVEYHEGKPVRVEAIVISTQHLDSVSNAEIEQTVLEQVINSVVPADMIDEDTKIYVNPSGRFALGGPQADAGLTGRKIIVDTYGGMARHGGGAFSGKDATKVDRSAAYAARYVAKNIVAAGLADRFEIQVSYAIGKAHPVSIMVETFGTGVVSDETIEQLVREHVRSPAGGDHPRPRSPPPDLSADCCVRSLRSHRCRPSLGADGQGRGAPGRGRCLIPGEHARLGGSAFQVHRNHRAASERGRPYSSFKPKFAGRVQRRIFDIDSHGHDFDLADLEGTELHIPERLQRLDDRK